jgi:RNA polymerase sigma factor (sigma-70 family)
MDEKELIAQCRKEDAKAQKFLYNKYSGLMLGLCVRYSKGLTDAEDILQEGFLKIFRNIKFFTGIGSFEGWMKRIFINTAITYYHKNLKHQYHQDITEINETTIQNKDDEYEKSEFSKEELLDVIKSLSDGYRMIFNLYAIEGYKHKEIAGIMNIDINTSKSQYSRAKKIIQKKLLELKQLKYVKLQKKY